MMEKKYDYLVVGSGLFGAVFAHEAKEHGKKVLVIDKRYNIAGNVYTEKIEGINVHIYGAHIFHTNLKHVWKYVTQFAEFNRFTNSPVANYHGELFSLGEWDPRPVFKTNSSQFLPIRTVVPKVPMDILKKIGEYFPTDDYEFPLDPSYEFTNSLEEEHTLMKPYAIQANVAVFKELQKLESVGLVEPIGEEHMYVAAMHSKACRLTELGKHFRKLAEKQKL